MNNCLVSWSGGKDSCYALMKAISKGCKAVALLNVLNEEGKISRSHGIPEVILRAQAASLAVPISLIASSWSDYEKNFITALKHLKQTTGATEVIFGDIDLEAHKEWEEKVCEAAELKAMLPLWKQNRKVLVYEMLAQGIKTIIVSCNETMGKQYLGEVLNHSLIKELEELNIDPCGENGEFHTLVLDAPIFSKPILVEVTKKIMHQGYWFSELNLL